MADKSVSGPIIFRWYYRNPKTGELVYPKHGKPFPIRLRRKAR